MASKALEKGTFQGVGMAYRWNGIGSDDQTLPTGGAGLSMHGMDYEACNEELDMVLLDNNCTPEITCTT